MAAAVTDVLWSGLAESGFISHAYFGNAHIDHVVIVDSLRCIAGSARPSQEHAEVALRG